ncbi:MAG: hypothetical protein ACI4WH_02900 [Oscillospiraceae bacterium]
MITIKNIEEFASIPQTDLTSYLEKRFSSMIEEYDCTITEIGEVEIFMSMGEFQTYYGKTALSMFETIQTIGEYLHLVLIVDDYYTKDIYVPIARQVI